MLKYSNLPKTLYVQKVRKLLKHKSMANLLQCCTVAKVTVLIPDYRLYRERCKPSHWTQNDYNNRAQRFSIFDKYV